MMHSIWGSAAAGIFAHTVAHQHEPRSLHGFAALLFLLPVAISLASRPESLLAFVTNFARAVPVYWASLAASVATYRLSPFHPLARYPGPLLARVSRLWALRVVLGGKQHLVSHQLFERYGDVVRTGPNHLIIRDPAAIPTILGGRDMWLKGDRYDAGNPEGSTENLITQMTTAGHAERRKIWDRAFTPSALQAYEPLLDARVSELVEQLSSRVGTEIDIAEWVSLLALDIMGDFAFSGLFNNMRAGADTTHTRHGIEEAIAAGEALGTIPWTRALVLKLSNTKNNAALNMARAVAEKRKAQRTRTRDLFYYLLDEDGEGGHPSLTTTTLAHESMLAMGAGSGTTSAALSNALFYLLTVPGAFDKLRTELDAVAGNANFDVSFKAAQLADLSFLNGVIHETLRLWPAIPNGVQRTPPPHGGSVAVAGHEVPVGTTVQIPTWSLHRDSRYFHPEPHAFLPERWTAEGPSLAKARGQEFRLDKAAWMPFNYGPGNCIGRALAMNEMRAVLAILVRRFDMRLAPGFEPGDWERNLVDGYALRRGPLPVVMSERT